MRQLRSIVLFSLLGMLLSTVAFPGTSKARVFRVFGPETFTRSTKGPATEVRQFLVQYPRVYDFTLHIFDLGIKIKKGPSRATPSAVVTLNGEQVATPDDFNRNTGYFKKPITLSDLNSLSVELRGNPGSGLGVVITARNDEPLSFNVQDIIHPDGSNLFGANASYFWSILDQPDGSKFSIDLDRDPSSPGIGVDQPGEYALELVISGDFWETDPIPVKLLATVGDHVYPDFIPVPVKTRVVTGNGDQYGDYSIQVGNTIYPAPAPTYCGSPGLSGFQVLVLDRATLAKKEIEDHQNPQSFNVPCGSSDMVDFLNLLDNSSLVIVSSLFYADAMDVCNSSSSCPLGAKLIEFGATDIFTANYSSTLNYNLNDYGNTPIPFTYSLIGVRGLGQGNGIELNDWDHRVKYYNNDGLKRLSSNIEGSFVKDVNPGITSNWTFVYPEFIEIQTHTGTTTAANTIMVGSVPYHSTALPAGAMGAFQTVQLYGDTLTPLNYPLAETYFTNSGTGTGSMSESQQKLLLDDLNRLWTPDRFITVITTFGTPIGYKSDYFTDLIKTIGNDLGGTIGILNDLGGATYSYSLLGMTNPTSDYNPVAYPLGSADTADASSSSSAQEHNLRVVMHKDRQGWFKPVIAYPDASGDTDSHSDFSLVSVALQPAVPWPLPDPTDPTYQEQLSAYQYISDHVTTDVNTDIRSEYVSASDLELSNWVSRCSGLYYRLIIGEDFSEQVFTDMKKQICGLHDANNNIPGEIDYLGEVRAFTKDMDNALLNMRINSSPDMKTVYDLVAETVEVPDNSSILYDAGMVVRGILTAAGSIVPNAAIKGTMGVINGALTIAMNFSQKPEGPDYTTIDTAYSSLQNEMDMLWENCTTGTHKLMSMIESDWGKLQYVGVKFNLPHSTLPENGGPGWQYDHTNDPDNWNKVVTNNLQAYYLKYLMPAVWHIDYMIDSTNINNPWNFGYGISCGYNCVYDCAPYCIDRSSNTDAYQVDALMSGYSWYVLTDYLYDGDCDPCLCVRYDRSATLRDILFGQGTGTYDDTTLQKLQLDKRVFYERWLPASVYRHPERVDWGYEYYYTTKCESWGS